MLYLVWRSSSRTQNSALITHNDAQECRMPFDLTTWRADIRALVDDFARDPHGALNRTGVHSLYGFLIGSTILPVAAAYAHEPASAISALIGVAGGLGANLLANLAQ